MDEKEAEARPVMGTIFLVIMYTVLATMPVQFGNIWTHCTAKNVITVLDYRIFSIFVKQ